MVSTKIEHPTIAAPLAERTTKRLTLRRFRRDDLEELAALDEGFDTMGLDEICSVPQTDNPASSRVCERIGMNLERNVTIPANSRRDELEALLYKMTRAQWQAIREQRR